MKTEMTITIPTDNKPNVYCAFRISFLKSDFEKVVDAIPMIKNYKELISSKLWTVI